MKTDFNTNVQQYTFEEHIHRYALWTAARAASKSLLSNTEVESLLSAIDLKNSIQGLKNQKLTIEAFDAWHQMKCCELMKAFDNLERSNGKIRRMSYGIAAKIINIYIKTAEIIATKGNSELSFYAHPPVDSVLLKRINKELSPGSKLNTTWSTFGYKEYSKAIKLLRLKNDNKAFWNIEVYWKL